MTVAIPARARRGRKPGPASRKILALKSPGRPARFPAPDEKRAKAIAAQVSYWNRQDIGHWVTRKVGDMIEVWRER